MCAVLRIGCVENRLWKGRGGTEDPLGCDCNNPGMNADVFHQAMAVEVIGNRFWVYFKGRATRICRWIGHGHLIKIRKGVNE